MNALVICCALETGFVGDWCFNEDDDVENVLSTYAQNWSYSFDRQQILDFAKMPTTDFFLPHQSFKLKFSLEPDNEINVHSLDSGDILLLSAHLIDSSVMSSAQSIALPVSRYIISKTINTSKLSISFRNLGELSIKLKNEIFLPLRNNIFGDKCNPSLQGVLGSREEMILQFLKRKDIINLSMTCKLIRARTVPYLMRNKLKK